ncbi:MAG: type II CAAX endopeptidase family protein [Anaerolineales bacterium]
MRNITNRPVISILFLLAAPIAGLALGVGLGFLLGLNGTDAGNFIANAVFLLVVLSIIPLYRFSVDELGLKIIKAKWGFHVAISLAVFASYLLVYIFVIRISGLRPVDSETIWGLVTYAVVVLAEEIHIRGILYRALEKRFSGIIALIGSSVIFGLLHATQGVRGAVSKAMSGWLWGSIRYSTGMILLVIFPIHFTYNSMWLLFEGNWNNPPAWAPYALPLLEFLLGLAIVIFTNKRTKSEK